MLLGELPELSAADLSHACRRAQDRPPERMTCEKCLLESVVDIVGGGVLVRLDLIDHHAFFHGDLLFREGGAGGELKKQRHRLAQILFEDGGMDHDLLLGREGVELASEFVEVAVDDPGTLALGSFEQRVFREMCYPVVEVTFIPRPAFDCQRAVAHGVSAPLDRIGQPLPGCSYDHYFLSDLMALRSLVRNPLPLLALILCFLK